jgi:hypothetical protein
VCTTIADKALTAGGESATKENLEYWLIWKMPPIREKMIRLRFTRLSQSQLSSGRLNSHFASAGVSQTCRSPPQTQFSYPHFLLSVTHAVPVAVSSMHVASSPFLGSNQLVRKNIQYSQVEDGVVTGQWCLGDRWAAISPHVSFPTGDVSEDQ